MEGSSKRPDSCLAFTDERLRFSLFKNVEYSPAKSTVLGFFAYFHSLQREHFKIMIIIMTHIFSPFWFSFLNGENEVWGKGSAVKTLQQKRLLPVRCMH